VGQAVLDTFDAAIRALTRAGARFCVVGGIARSLLAEPRSTTDIDLAVEAESEADVDEIVRSLQTAGFQVREVFLKRETRRVATVRLTLGDGDVRADLFFATSGLEGVVVRQATRMELLPGLKAPVIKRPHLIATKLIAARPQDLADIAVLLERSSPSEVRRVSKAPTHLPEGHRRAAAETLWRGVVDA